MPIIKTALLGILSLLIFSCSKLQSTSPEAASGGSNPGNAVLSERGQITMEHFIGANAFIDDPIDKLKAVGFIREYHNWGWDEGNGDPNYPKYPNNQIALGPGPYGQTWWNFDNYYRDLKNENVMVSPCIQGAPGWLNANNNFPSDHKPIDSAGKSTTDPHSYHIKAHHMYQYAARYGATAVNVNLLTLSANQPKTTGAGTIKYIEDYNEQDKDWMGPDAQFSPEEYAAMASADYDGHEKRMTGGKGTFGIKNADPKMKFVMGGLATYSLDYIRRMKTWFEANRSDRKFVPDVINFHMYAMGPTSQPTSGGPGISPEAAQFKEKAAAITAYRDSSLPVGTEVWFSEFGWDTFAGSPLAAPAIGGEDTFETQGRWLVRAYMAFAAAGVDRVQMYMMRDVDPNSTTWFGSSGLIAQKGDFTPKKSWYYVYTMKNVLSGMRYYGEQASGNSNILIYKFKELNSDKGVYVVWFKTSNNSSATNFSLAIPASNATASQVSLSNGSTTGTSQALSVQSSAVKINVSEKPIFIKVEHMK